MPEPSFEGKLMIALSAKDITNHTTLKKNNLKIFQSIPSTHEYLKAHAQPSRDWQGCLSEMQTHGIGRGRHQTWHSPFGENIYLSLLCTFNLGLQSISPFSLVMGIVAARTLEACYSLPTPITLKWPNDVWCNHQKIGGILIETQTYQQDASSVLISLGLNINMTHAPDDAIQQNWTSVRLQTGKYHDRNPCCRLLIQQLEQVIPQFEAEGFRPFMPAWKDKDALIGQPIQVKLGERVVSGEADGVNEQGQLCLYLPNSQTIALSSGETRLLKQSVGS